MAACLILTPLLLSDNTRSPLLFPEVAPPSRMLATALPLCYKGALGNIRGVRNGVVVRIRADFVT